MGITVTLLATARRLLWDVHEGRENKSGESKGLYYAALMMSAIVGSYALQLTLAYFIMLFVMTYQVGCHNFIMAKVQVISCRDRLLTHLFCRRSYSSLRSWALWLGTLCLRSTAVGTLQDGSRPRARESMANF